MEFEPTVPVFELAKGVHALDRAATVIGIQKFTTNKQWWDHVERMKEVTPII
jgi:hypothetical protein